MPAQGRAALYHRVSTLDQDPTLARVELRAAAKRLGYCVVLDVEETGSGARIARLLMTVLAAVAEFERHLIRDRTRLGLAAARRRGVRLGRRPLPGPAPAAALQQRAAGRSWTRVAAELGWTVGKARRLAAAASPRRHGTARGMRSKETM